MLRAVVVLGLCAFGLCLGCGPSDSKATNPDKLEYSKEPPPKRNPTPAKK